MDVEFQKLIGEVLDGEASPESYRRFQGLLESRAELREEYIEAVNLDVSLRYKLAIEGRLFRSAADDLEPKDDTLSTKPTTLRNTHCDAHGGAPLSIGRRALQLDNRGVHSWRELIAWTAVAVGFLGFVAYLAAPLDHKDGEATRPTTAEKVVESRSDALLEVATIAGGVDARFGKGLALGSRLTPGILRLETGVAQVAFDRGAIFVIEGPARFEIVDATACRLLSGSMSVDLLPGASSFQVAAGGIQVSDRNAQFGLRTAPHSSTEVHTLGGGLNLVSSGGGLDRPMHLSSGEAVRWQAENNVVKEISSDPSSFILRSELDRRRRQSERRAYARWLKYSRQWSDDPSVVLRYDFDTTLHGEILNTIDRRRLPGLSRQSAPRWIAGRWSDNMSMVFDGRTDAVDVLDDPALRLKEDFTLAIWLRTRSYTNSRYTLIVGKGKRADRNYALWLCADGRVLWQVCPDKDPETDAEWRRHGVFSEALQIGKWQLVVGVVDGGAQRLYVDGELQGECSSAEHIATSNDPLVIGHFEGFPAHEEFLCGDIDELILLNRAMKPIQIREMYQLGKPTYDTQEEDLNINVRQEEELSSVI